MLRATNAFSRAKAMMAAIQVAMMIGNVVERQAALNSMDPYRSRGKGRSKTAPSRHHVAMDKRTARKARNVKRHKAASRG
jgi:tmRNA-binding protein